MRIWHDIICSFIALDAETAKRVSCTSSIVSHNEIAPLHRKFFSPTGSNGGSILREIRLRKLFTVESIGSMHERTCRDIFRANVDISLLH
jgi:hypothetical protein